MPDLDAAEADARSDREGRALPPAEVHRYLENLPSWWAEPDPDDRLALAATLFERIRALGISRVELDTTQGAQRDRLTASSGRHALVQIPPERYQGGVGERVDRCAPGDADRRQVDRRVAGGEGGQRAFEIVLARSVEVWYEPGAERVGRHVEPQHRQFDAERLRPGDRRPDGSATYPARTNVRTPTRRKLAATARRFSIASRGSVCSSQSTGAVYQQSQSRSMAATKSPAAASRSTSSTARVDLPAP
jgi:hypothetical protein